MRDGALRGDRVLRVAAVVRHAGDAEIAARDEIAAAAAIARCVVTAVPPDADAISDRKARYVVADCIDRSRDLVTGNARIGYSRKRIVQDEEIAVADSACGNLNSHLAAMGLRNGDVDQF